MHSFIVKCGRKICWIELNCLKPCTLALKGAFEEDETTNAFVKDISEMVCPAQAC